MKRILFAAAALGSFAATSAGAFTPTYTDGSTAVFNGSAVGAQYTFESATTGNVGNPAGFTRTGGQVMSGNVGGLGANPAFAPDNNNYLYVTTGGESTVRSSALGIIGYQNISFFIGSIDAGNTVSVLGLGGVVLRSFTGTQLAAPTAANGQQTIPQTNRLISFAADAGEVLTGLRFNSSVNSLEVDNIRFTNAVPEPATWAMMLLGFGMVAGAARYRRRSANVVYG